MQMAALDFVLADWGKVLFCGIQTDISDSSRSQEFLEQQASEARRIVADYAMLFQQIVRHQANLHLRDIRAVDHHRFGALRPITPRHLERYRLAVLAPLNV